MGTQRLDDRPMSVEAFLAFTDTRPDEERWELFDGEPLLNASPVYRHQIITANVLYTLMQHLRDTGSLMAAIPGIGVRVSSTSLPVPDVLVRPRGGLLGPVCDDMVIAVEVLSPSTRARDLRWKREAYTALPSLSHYVTLAPDIVEATLFDRADGFAPHRLADRFATLHLGAIGLSLTLDAFYRDTGLVD